MFYSFYLKYKYGKFHYYFTVNAFTAWVGNILKSIGFVNKTIFWVWDYYPPFHQSKTVVLMRSLYWQFDKLATNSDVLIFLNRRITKLRKEIGVLSKKDKHKIIPIGTTNNLVRVARNLKQTSKIKLVFLGVVKKSQGLDLVFDNSKELAAAFPNLEVNIIGGGPDLEYFKSRLEKTSLKINFYGYLLDKDVNKILKKSHIGLAPYVPSQENASYYGDPSKIKKYISFDLPVITTNVFEFSKELKRANAGVLIDHNKKKELVSSIHQIINNYKSYRKNARLLNQRYYYKKLYPKMFTPYLR
jgi:glycosyltransferase involved in cell wall biosynthesis